MPTQADLTDRYVINKKVIREFILGAYGINPVSISEIKSGMINTSIRIDSLGESYLLRIYRRNGRSRREISRELDFCALLRKRKIPVPEVIKGRRGTIQILKFSKSRHYFAVLFTFLPGSHTQPNQHVLIPSVAKFHAMMHGIGKKNRNGSGRSIEGIMSWLRDEHAASQAKLKTRHPDLTRKLRALYQEVVAEHFSKKDLIAHTAFALAHLDYDSSNILNNGWEVTGIIDFDDLAVVPMALDLGFSLWWWCYFNPSREEYALKRYLASYSRTRKLSASEKILLPFFMRVRNLILLNLLFVNASFSVQINALEKGIKLDTWLKNLSI